MEQNKSIKVWGYPSNKIPHLARVIRWCFVGMLILTILGIFVGPSLSKKDILDGGVIFLFVAFTDMTVFFIAVLLSVRAGTIRKQRGFIYVYYEGRFYVANVFELGFASVLGLQEKGMQRGVGSVVGNLASTAVGIPGYNLFVLVKELLGDKTEEEQSRYVLSSFVEYGRIEKYIKSGALKEYLEPMHIIDGVKEGKRKLKLSYQTFNGKKYMSKETVIYHYIRDYEELKAFAFDYADKFKLKCPSCGGAMNYGICKFCGKRVSNYKPKIIRLLRLFFIGKQ